MRIVEHDLRPTTPATNGTTAPPADRLAADIPALGALARRDADRADVLIVRAGPDRTDEEIRALGRSVSTAVGRLLVQDAAGALERDVFDRMSREGPQRFSATADAAPMHTDGMHVPDQHVPDYFSLTCLRQAAVGGELAFVHLPDVLAALGEEAERVVQVLSGEFWFHTKGVDPQGREAVRRRVLEPDGAGGHEISYAREYIDLGHALPEAPGLDAEQTRVLDRLDEILADETRWHRHRLERGDTAVIDNRRVLHARSPFIDAPGQPARRMMRLWIQRPEKG